MSVADPSVRARRFDALYRDAIDPWDFRRSDYEREKFRSTLDALPLARYRRAVEVGCSIGELTRRLGERADEVLGLDVSAVAIEEARRVHGATRGLRFETAELPRDWPPGAFDLVVLSEVLYFLSRREIDALAVRVADALAPGGHCLAVCWLGETDEAHDLDGNEAAERFATALAETDGGAIVRDTDRSFREPRYRLDVFGRVAPVPVGGRRTANPED